MVRIPAQTMGHRHVVRSTQTAGVGTGKQDLVEHVLLSPGEGVRVGRPRAPTKISCSFRDPAADYQEHGMLDGGRARIQLENDELL